MTQYDLQQINPNVLSVLDVVDAGKVVTAETWKYLWELVINRINAVNAFCNDVAELHEDLKETNATLKATVTDFNVKYDALKDSFVHYGTDAPTNADIKFWIQPAADPTVQVATKADTLSKPSMYLGTKLEGPMAVVNAMDMNNPVYELLNVHIGDFYMNTSTGHIYCCTAVSVTYSDWIRIYPTAAAARVVDITLEADAWGQWNGEDQPYMQYIRVGDITEYSKIDLNPSVAQLNIFYNKDISFVVENAHSEEFPGTVIVYCIGQKPTSTYTIQATITEVYF